MKKFFFLVFFTQFLTAEPLRLTCEVGADILYLHLEDEKENSWWKPHDDNLFKSGVFEVFGARTFQGKENKLDEMENNIASIFIKITGRQSGVKRTAFIKINKYNLKVSARGSGSGQCYRGFKNYELPISQK